MSAEPPEHGPGPLGAHPGGQTWPGRRARPVAGLPLDSFLARSEEAARRWAVALIVTRPLEAAAAIPLGTLAAGAPSLIEQVTRALGSDAAFDELLAEAGSPGLAAFAGSARPAALAEAAEALRGVLWELLLEVLPRGPEPAAARLVGDLSDRLAQTCAGLLAAALERGAGGPPGREAAFVPAAAPTHPASMPAAAFAPAAGFASAAAPAPAAAAVPAPARARAARSPVDSPPDGAGPGEGAEEQAIVIVDERRAAYAPIERPPFRERVAATDTVGAAELRRRADLAAQAPVPVGAEVAGGAEISVRDERAEETAAQGPAAWVGSIGRELRRHEQDGEPFAVLLIDAPGGQDAAGELVDRGLEDALAAELREMGGSLTRERAGRWWALAPRTDRLGAHALSVRLSQVVEVMGRRTGTAGTVSIGTAVCPEDGTQAAALAAQADVGLYASRSQAGTGTGQPVEPA